MNQVQRKKQMQISHNSKAQKGNTPTIHSIWLIWIISIIASVTFVVVFTPHKNDDHERISLHLLPVSLLKHHPHPPIHVERKATTISAQTQRTDAIFNGIIPTLHGNRAIGSNKSGGGNKDDEHDTLRYTLLEDGTTRLVIRPWRSPDQKALAARCTRSGRGNIYIKHFRKTGGTALYQAIRVRNCAGGKKELTHVGNQPPDRVNFVYAQEFPFFDVRTFDAMDHPDRYEYRSTNATDSDRHSDLKSKRKRNTKTHANRRTVYVTSLRHPISRIESMYWYEGKWPRNCSMACENTKQKDDTTAVVQTLEEWALAVRGQTRRKELRYVRHTGCGQWMGVDNYYIRQLLGVDRASANENKEKLAGCSLGFLNVTLTRTHLHRAKEILASFDVVMIQEDMARKSWGTAMFLDLITPNDALRKRRPAKLAVNRRGVERTRDQYRPLPNSTRRMLEEWNKLDLELYDYAVELSRSTVKQWRKQPPDKEEDDAVAAAECGGAAVAMNSSKFPLSDEVFDIAIGGRYCCPGPACPKIFRGELPVRGFWYFFPGCIWSSNGASKR
eukprot:jgi/Psemu1/287392/fgenesh1_pg.189_\